MNSIRIRKVTPLKGSVKISGSKNAAIPIVCTSLLSKGVVELKNVPRISDIMKLLQILMYLNCKIRWKRNSLMIDSKSMEYKPLIIEQCSEIRGSYYLIPVFLLLFGKCEIVLPGGCKIGQRPIDAHLAAFEAMGYSSTPKGSHLWVEKKKEVKQINYTMTKASVGASINAILCALNCDYAVIDELVLEPEGLAVIEFLKQLGFTIDSLNKKCVIKKRKEPLVYKYSFTIIPDRMEAMTFIIMGLLCGNIKVKNINVQHMKYPLDLLRQAGYNISVGKNMVKVVKSKGNCFNIKTDLYPLFPTDMQPLFGVLLACGRGSCVVEETIFENRMQIYRDLSSVGASINVIENKAFIIGGNPLKPSKFHCVDLRQGAALMLMILKYGGQADHIELIKRGYDSFFYKIKMLGARFSIQ